MQYWCKHRQMITWNRIESLKKHRHTCPSAYDKGGTEVGKRVFSEQDWLNWMSIWNLFYTNINPRRNAQLYARENTKISIRHSWRMFLWSWSRQKFFFKGYKKHYMYREKLASYVSIRLRNEFIKGHHWIKKKKIKDQGLNMESK